LDELGKEIAEIAVPAALALAADPVASLVDTFIGHIGHYFSTYSCVMGLCNSHQIFWLVSRVYLCLYFHLSPKIIAVVRNNISCQPFTEIIQFRM
jgi:hypothetical protein